MSQKTSRPQSRRIAALTAPVLALSTTAFSLPNEPDHSSAARHHAPLAPTSQLLGDLQSTQDAEACLQYATLNNAPILGAVHCRNVPADWLIRTDRKIERASTGQCLAAGRKNNSGYGLTAVSCGSSAALTWTSGDAQDASTQINGTTHYLFVGNKGTVAPGPVGLIPSNSSSNRAVFKQRSSAVSLGDSYISGEAGRWLRNWRIDGDRGDRGRGVYGNSGSCHRSDSAPIHSLDKSYSTVRHVPPRMRTLNFACSGAESSDVSSQASQLENAAKNVGENGKIRAVYLSIGGNDAKFAKIIELCSQPQNDCSQAPHNLTVMNWIGGTKNKIKEAVQSVKRAMQAAGYGSGSYRLVLQSYPSPIPRSKENEYNNWTTRWSKGGCPFNDGSSNFARDTVVKLVSAEVRDAAKEEGVEFLDLQNAFQGHEVCSKGQEWIRYIKPGYKSNDKLGDSDGDKQEFLHPNFHGQKEIGQLQKNFFARR
ncbi:GDSL-type esterase/lipase family protein [Streptomyces rimosus]|uniref:GDSL-type esterase/lipase family protein n=1 Tax=Streptomyces rimosus TaxID=1927 RepID=UPI00131E5373|nr:GDSL-type esterase/lipase family protein [Streptomyces rimosus]